MKYYLIILLTLLVAGCTKSVDPVFPETPDERLQKTLTAYRSKLIQAPGWKLFVYPSGLASQDIEVGGLAYYLRFPDSNRVSMVSDFRLETAQSPKESGYRIRADQRPQLVFDTYSYIHLAADPDPDVSNSPTQQPGFGWGTDFEFEFTKSEPGDTLFLEGVFNKSQAIMLPATQEEIDAAFGGRLAHIVESTKNFSASTPFLFFTGSDNSQIEVSFNLFLSRINFNYISDNSAITTSVPFSHTTYGVHFKNPVTVGGYTFQDMFWDDAQNRYYIETSGGRVNISGTTTPIIAFHLVLGRAITSITVPQEPLPGQSNDFIAIRNQINNDLINGPYGLALLDMIFTFDANSSSMTLYVLVEQGGVVFVLQYQYNYTINSSNIANFTRTGQNGNAGLVQNEMAPLINRIDNDNFKLDYFTGVAPPLGQFTSQNTPGFEFTGNLE